MAPISHGRGGLQGQDGGGPVNGAPNHGPPPSTLAAQLVENISNSNRSSRPDETAELKKCFTVIENIKNRPELLKTQHERIEHNHMLIYVYSRVVLESLRWDDPFADKPHLRAEALKAINFIKITIRETPEVLLVQSGEGRFLFRSQEPLWLWVLPKVLKLLGHPDCPALSPAIESLFHDIYIVACQTGSLWPFITEFLSYLQHTLNALLDDLRNSQSSVSGQGAHLKISLPSDNTLMNLADVNPHQLRSQCTYQLLSTDQAIRHASMLQNIFSSLIVYPQVGHEIISVAQEYTPWLLDAFSILYEIEQQTSASDCTYNLLQKILWVYDGLENNDVVNEVFRRKVSKILTTCSLDVISRPQILSSDQVCRSLCLALAKLAKLSLSHKPTARALLSQLIPELETLVSQGDGVLVSGDLRNCLQILKHCVVDPSSGALEACIQQNQFQDQDLRAHIRKLKAAPAGSHVAQRKVKRQKVSVESHHVADLWKRLCDLLGATTEIEHAQLSAIVLDGFPKLTDSQMCETVSLLGHLGCAADNSLSVRRRNETEALDLSCSYCSAPDSKRDVSKGADSDIKLAALESFVELIKMKSFLETRRPRVTAMTSLRRLARHSNNLGFFNVETSAAAQWCLQSLHSSVRELRIAASRTLPVFLTKPTSIDASSDIAEKNCGAALSVLRSLSDQNSPHLAETCVMAWSQLGKVVPDDQLNLVLVKLVEYLNFEDVVAPAVAFTEIQNVARSRNVSTRQLFAPFWQYIAFSAVKDLPTRSKLASRLASLLDMNLQGFLLSIEGEALPWLVLTKKRDVIQKIAEARGETEPWQPCLHNENLGRILSLLLVQETEDIEGFSMQILRQISSHFEELTFVELLQLEPLITTLELLKAAGDAETDRKAQARSALNYMATKILAANRNMQHKKSHATAYFLQQHVLGLMTRLTEVISDTMNSRPPVQEQRRCIAAMEEMIKIGKASIRIARSQISACLLASMAHDELRSAAFSCWAAMLTYLDEEDVEVLVETTFYLVNHYWNDFTDNSQQQAYELLEFLLENERDILERYISKLPSLSHIGFLSKIESKLSAMRQPVDSRTAFHLLAERISHGNSGVVLQALQELALYLQKQQAYLQASAVSEQPDSVIPMLARALFDCVSKYNGDNEEITRLCTQCIGLMGCVDSNRVEAVRADKQMIVASNFEDSSETTDFVLFLLEHVLVKSFLSATDARLQGFQSYAMQELLERCDIGAAYKMQGSREADVIFRKFMALSENAREILTPFLNSRYKLASMPEHQTEYPIFRPGRLYATWMRTFTVDLLRRPQPGSFAEIIFEPLCRVIRAKDMATAEFVFPYALMHVVISDSTNEASRTNILRELRNALEHELPAGAPYAERESRKLFCEAVFRVLDYAMRWMQVKRTQQQQTPKDTAAMERIQSLLDSIPAELISQRAVDCEAFSRALFHLEQHIRGVEADKKGDAEKNRLLQRLQDIYTQIDEPDGLEGISAHLHVLDINQQVLSHRKAGRWSAAQTWYEIKLAEDPDNLDVQVDLLTCLKESGQHDVLLNYVEGIEKHTAVTTINRIVPFAVEASWATSRWQTMEKFISRYQGDQAENFNVYIAKTLLHLQKGHMKAFVEDLKTLRARIGSSMTVTATASMHACHDPMLRCHVLTDLELIAGINNDESQHVQETLKTLGRRLEVLGSYVNDKQYLLSIRRAAMELMRDRFTNLDISSLWLSTARLARKANSMHQSFNAVLHASQLGDDSATIENARLLWKDGHNRKAIQILQGALADNTFNHKSFPMETESSEKNPEHNMVTARAHLLLAKWLDNAGQTHASALRSQFQMVPKNYGTWEKGHYYLGRHYKKVLESEQALKPDDQSDEYLTGETAKLVIENYLRSLNYGTKYLYQTLPRILTLWLELGAQLDKAPTGKVSLSRELHHRRKTQLSSLHAYMYKHIQRMPAYIFYTALPQLVARIAHPNPDVFQLLEQIILKVVEAHPRQALWSLFAIMTSRQATSERKARGQSMLQKLRGTGKKVEGSYDLKSLLRMGEKLADQLLVACNNGDFQSNRTTYASITRDLNFNHKCTPCPLVVPIEACLTATLPTLTDNVKKHKAFSRDVITIEHFLDEVMVLGSLAKPRKLTARGSDGKNYALLIKPKDDLRTDQRLMEFNSMINRSLKRDAESSRRQLYIKTYAVTPLNEECGIIEWVDGLKTLRDILLGIYRSRNIVPNYSHIAQMMKDAVTGEKNIKIFTETVLNQFPPVLPNWFISQFPNPSTWFSARLKYTRSCAVMSMVGTILGLGDRHGENVLLEEGNGGVFHVDFNCLFDKGLTFAQPERVPFRLTHNMVAAMGIYGYEGPFRHCSELTLSILRQQEETLMTILEAFIHDPTLDLQKDKKRKNEVVKLNPQSVVDSIRRKVRGLLPDESIPLGVEGQVEELIKQAVNPRNLSAMYIGWCPFL